MSLRANVTQQGEITVVALEGKLDYESQDVLKESLVTMMRAGRKLVVDFGGLNFVGSSGITHFIRSLYEIQESGQSPPRFCNVKSEFRKIIAAYDIHGEFSIHETREAAMNDFFRPGIGESH
jgi:anti-anti-sigma factor